MRTSPAPCFSFLVPAVAADDVDAQSRASVVRPAPAATFRTAASIWILDDDPVALESLQPATPEQLLATIGS